MFIDSEEDNSGVARLLKVFPESKLMFASNGKYLLEIPAEKRRSPSLIGDQGAAFLPFACVKTTRSAPQPEFAAVEA